jgi:hypothetical protein
VFSSDLLDTEFGNILAVKLTVVLSVILLSALHDFVLGPRLVRVMEALAQTTDPQAQGPPGAAALQRRRLSLLARLNVLLAVLVLALAVVLVRGLP